MRVTCRMLHSLMVQVETYLTHNSFSRKRGGFKVKINGVQIYKVSRELGPREVNLLGRNTTTS